MRLIISLMLLMLVTAGASAQTFINISAEPDDSFNAVLVEKAGKWLHVLRISEGNVTVLKSFQVLTGASDGDKMVQGDEKTPEGLYYVRGYLSPEKLRSMYGDVAKQYGTGAYPLSYPNLKDRLDRKTGGGIWLHGVDPEREEPATKGCVAFDNDNLSMMAEYIKVGTPVVITDEGMQGSLDDLQDHFQKAKNQIEEYMTAWQSSDEGKFESFYSADFRDAGGKSRDQYIAFKKYLMKIYPYRVTRADNFRVFTQTATESVTEFDQFYCADNVVSYGRKRFYMAGDGIVSEEFMPMDASGYVRAELNEFLLGWKAAWESLEIDTYISFYGEDFSTRGMDRAGWLADKSGKFADLKSVKVQIESISFTQISPTSYKVEFVQVYKGDEYSDKGVKTLRLTGCPGDFKIKSEFWRAM